MTRPNIFLFRMLAFVAAVLLVAGLLSGALITAFSANILLNSLIVLVLILGIGWNIRQVMARDLSARPLASLGCADAAPSRTDGQHARDPRREGTRRLGSFHHFGAGDAFTARHNREPAG
jgi:hypothetical protein